MEKATKYMNCAVCERRRQCWNTEHYGDFGEMGKLQFPHNAVCSSFTCKKENQ